jgi:hypothetical protein
MIDPMRMRMNAVPPPVHLQALRADLRGYTVAEKVEFPLLTKPDR